MPKVTEAHLEARRQQVLDAASSCFSRQGFHQTTMQDICREAGLSPGAVYRYFASKEEIIAASCECSQVQSLETLGAAMAQGRGTLEALEQLAEATLGLLKEPGAHEQMRMNVQLWAEALRSPQVMGLLRRANLEVWRQGLAGIMQGAQQRGEVNPSLDAESAALVLLSTWYGLVLQKALDLDVDVAKYVAVVKALYSGLFWRGPGAPA